MRCMLAQATHITGNTYCYKTLPLSGDSMADVEPKTIG